MTCLVGEHGKVNSPPLDVGRRARRPKTRKPSRYYTAIEWQGAAKEIELCGGSHGGGRGQKVDGVVTEQNIKYY